MRQWLHGAERLVEQYGAVRNEAVRNTTVRNVAARNVAVRNVTVPNTTVPNTTVRNTTVPNTTVPNTTVPNTTVPNTTVRNTTVRNVTVELLGSDGAPGEVPATDVARLVLGVQAVLRRAAHVVLGRPRLATYGRYEADVEGATRLRLERVERGACVFALPDIERDDGELEV